MDDTCNRPKPIRLRATARSLCRSRAPLLATSVRNSTKLALQEQTTNFLRYGGTLGESPHVSHTVELSRTRGYARHPQRGSASGRTSPRLCTLSPLVFHRSNMLITHPLELTVNLPVFAPGGPSTIFYRCCRWKAQLVLRTCCRSRWETRRPKIYRNMASNSSAWQLTCLLGS